MNTKKFLVNVGSADRVVRLILAAALVVVGLLWGPLGVGPVIMYVVAAVLGVTALVRTCPIYSLFGLNSCPIDAQQRT